MSKAGPAWPGMHRAADVYGQRKRPDGGASAWADDAGPCCLGRLLGTGSYGDVFEAVCAPWHEPVAVKLVEKALLRQDDMRHRLAKEIEIHSQLRHPHVVSLLGCSEDERYVYLYTENCRGGELLSLSRAGKVTEAGARRLFGQLCSALVYLHGRGVMHRDIKLANLLLTEGGDLKLCDFGLATALESQDGERHTICGTPNYLSPEIVAHRPYTKATDLWSLGVVLYSLVAGRPPFQCPTVAETLRRVARADFDPAPPGVGPEAVDLIGRLLQIDPGRRCSLAEVMHHPFLRPPPAPGLGSLGGRPVQDSGWGCEGLGADASSLRGSAVFRAVRGAAGGGGGGGGGGGQGLEEQGIAGSTDLDASSLRGSAVFRAVRGAAGGGGGGGGGGEGEGSGLPRIDTTLLPGPVDHLLAGGALALSVSPGGGVVITHPAGSGRVAGLAEGTAAGGGGTFWVSPDGSEVAVRHAGVATDVATGSCLGHAPGGRETERRFATRDLPASLHRHYLFAAAFVDAVAASTPRVVYLGSNGGRPTRACLLPNGWLDVTWGPSSSGGGGGAAGVAGVRLPPPSPGAAPLGGGAGDPEGGGAGDPEGGPPPIAIVTWLGDPEGGARGGGRVDVEAAPGSAGRRTEGPGGGGDWGAAEATPGRAPGPRQAEGGGLGGGLGGDPEARARAVRYAEKCRRRCLDLERRAGLRPRAPGQGAAGPLVARGGSRAGRPS